MRNLGNVDTVVIKVGTSSITGGGNKVNEAFMDSVAEQVKVLKDEGSKHPVTFKDTITGVPYRQSLVIDGVSYENVCREVMGAKQRTQLRRLIGFRFQRHPSINLPEEHLQAIEKQIDLRVKELLSLPRVK